MLQMFGATVNLCFRLSFVYMTYMTMHFGDEDTGYIAQRVYYYYNKHMVKNKKNLKGLANSLSRLLATHREKHGNDEDQDRSISLTLKITGSTLDIHQFTQYHKD